MPSKKDLLNVLPPFKNDGIIITEFQNAGDIQREIINAHYYFSHDYDFIAGVFWTGDIYSTCRDIWEFLKFNLHYREESKEEQSSKSPARILAANEKIDCKHYSLFAGGVLDAIHRNYDDGFSWCYRFAGYKKFQIEHVFVVVDPGTDDEIWIDPVLPYFDLHEKPLYVKDSKIMALMRLSGVPDKTNTPIQITGDREAAVQAFLTAVNENVFGYKDLLKRNPAIVNTQLRQFFSPIDFSILKNILNG